MTQGRLPLWIAIALSALPAIAKSPPNRPDLVSATPLAACELQSLPKNTPAAYDRTVVLYSPQTASEDPLASYERTALGSWRMPAPADRDDPWLRVLLFAPKRPVVIDFAILIDGKSFREQREAWIDDVLADAKGRSSGVTASHDTAGNNSAASAGTYGPVAASEGTAPAAETSNDAAAVSNDEPVDKPVSTVAAQARQEPTMRQRLMDYLAASSSTNVGRDEVHWLLAEWGAGPAVVLLAPSLSWERATLAPLLVLLDQDGDGELSAGEIANMHDQLKRADFNNDDVVEISELRRAAPRPRTMPKSAGHALLMQLDLHTDFNELAETIHELYGLPVLNPSDDSRDADPTFGKTKVSNLIDEPADLTLCVEFNTGQDNGDRSAGISILAMAPVLKPQNELIVAKSDVISLDIGGDFVELSAAQGAVADGTSASATQIAIGAVIDGNPLERLIDPEQDGRYTLREREELGGLLAALDDNRDGAVAADEMPTPIRLAVTLGPHVHQLLATPTGSPRTIAPREAAPAPPNWFASMDKNKDGDLSRSEFLGTTEQFRQFDIDSDGLLSVEEALKLNAGR